MQTVIILNHYLTKSLSFLILIFSCLHLHAQEGETISTQWYIYTNVGRTIDLVNPGLNLSLGFNRSRTAAEISVTKLYDPYTNKDVEVTKGNMVSAGIYRNFNHISNKYSDFGTRIDYFQNSYTTIQRFNDMDKLIDNDSMYYYESYDDSLSINKKTITLNLLYRQRHYVGKFFLIFHCGLGIRYRDVTQSGRISESDVYEGDHPNVWEYADDPKPKFAIAIPISFSIGYRF